MPKTHDCRIPGCKEEFKTVENLFYHESQHAVDLPEMSEHRKPKFMPKFGKAVEITKERDAYMCQFPNCERIEGHQEEYDEEKQIEAHHVRQTNHPDYMVTLCSIHHGIVTREKTPVLDHRLISGLLSKLGGINHRGNFYFK